MDLSNSVFETGQSDVSVYRTAIRMAALIKQYAPLPQIRQVAERIIGHLNAYQSGDEAEAIYNFVQQNVRYVRDPLNWEYVKTPELLLREIEQYGQSAGDCDDMSVLGGTLLRSIGFPVAIKVTSYKPDREFSHVYLLVLVRGVWYPFDAIRSEFNFGDEQGDQTHPVPQVTRYSVIDVEQVPSLAYFL